MGDANEFRRGAFLLLSAPCLFAVPGERKKKESDAVWTEFIVKGKNKMPGYDKKLSDAEMKDVVAYVPTLVR